MLTRHQRSYLLVGQGLVPAVINFVLNGAIGWAMFRGLTVIPIWAVAGAAGPDTLGTCFFLPAITCLIVTPIVRRHVRSDGVKPLAGPQSLPPLLRRFQRILPVRAALFGLWSLVIAGTLSSAAFKLVGVEQMQFGSFLAFKASFAGVLGGLVTPMIGLVALTDPRTSNSPS